MEFGGLHSSSFRGFVKCALAGAASSFTASCALQLLCSPSSPKNEDKQPEHAFLWARAHNRQCVLPAAAGRTHTFTDIFSPFLPKNFLTDCFLREVFVAKCASIIHSHDFVCKINTSSAFQSAETRKLGKTEPATVNESLCTNSVEVRGSSMDWQDGFQFSHKWGAAG